MRTWVRVATDTLCGRCGAQLSSNAPAQLVTMPPATWKLLRCVACADGPVPDELPYRSLKPIELPLGFTRAGASRPEWLPYRE